LLATWLKVLCWVLGIENKMLKNKWFHQICDH